MLNYNVSYYVSVCSEYYVSMHECHGLYTGICTVIYCVIYTGTYSGCYSVFFSSTTNKLHTYTPAQTLPLHIIPMAGQYEHALHIRRCLPVLLAWRAALYNFANAQHCPHNCASQAGWDACVWETRHYAASRSCTSFGANSFWHTTA